MSYLSLTVFLAALALPAVAAAQTQLEIVYGFSRGGVRPLTRLVSAADGNFYGTTYLGGAYDWGTIFRMTPDGSVTTTLHSFSGGPGGAAPQGALIQAADNNFYGTTSGYSSYWGASGCGTVYRMTPAGVVTTLHVFAGLDGCRAYGALIQGRDGNFYGATYAGGAYNHGTIFCLGPDGTFTVVYSFGGGADGGGPLGGLVQGADGHFYGTTERDGAFGKGTIFRVTPAGVLTILHAFQGRSQTFPSELTLAADGALYGVTFGQTYFDDPSDPGTIFRVTLAGVFTQLHVFQGPEGWNSQGKLLLASDGSFYGASAPNRYSSDPYLIFRMTPQGVVTMVRGFGRASQTGTIDGLIEGGDGRLYGVDGIAPGGLAGEGLAFRMSKDGIFYESIHQFQYGSGGESPQSPLVRLANGDVVGLTRSGGTAGTGTVFKLTAGGVFTVLHSFDSSEDLLFHNGLMQARNGRLYGTTGSRIFSMGTDGGFTVERQVDPFGTDTSYPSRVIEGADGNFYGSTIYDIGTVNFPTCGAIFRMTPARDFTVLHQFTGLYGGPDGCHGSPLIQANDGNFYGTTTNGGPADYGTIFRMTPGGSYAVLYTFDGAAGQGRRPRTALTQGSDGHLYGTTESGGANNHGTAFRISLAGAFTQLHSFDGTDGSHPWSALVEGPDRNFYGTTSGLTSTNRGTAFAMTPAGAVTLLHTFHGDDGDLFGFGGLTWAGGGVFYGVADQGPSRHGEIFRLHVRGTLSGRVRAAATGAPVANARLTIEPGGSTATTDASGLYSVALPIGVYTVKVMGDGYQASRILNVIVGPNAVTTSDVALSPPTLRAGDYDGDGRIDVATWQPSSGTWRIRQSSNGQTQTPAWGNGMWPYEDVPVPADYDGDGKTDIAIWRPSTGTWWIVQSGDGRGVSATWGNGMPPYNDVPVPADYDGDGKTDIAIWRPSTGTWWIVRSGDGRSVSVTWGAGLPPYDDVPVPADYDGDGKADVAVWRPSSGRWWIVRSGDGVAGAVGWGAGLAPYNDVPVPADYDGDGKTDIAIWRPSTGTWWIVRSSDGRGVSVTWGNGLAPYYDQPVPADYDGDGTADIAIWRPSAATWWIVRSSDGGIVTVTQGL
jgi:uncharacterized repeat protein (TIGR03803 family)